MKFLADVPDSQGYESVPADWQESTYEKTFKKFESGRRTWNLYCGSARIVIHKTTSCCLQGGKVKRHLARRTLSLRAMLCADSIPANFAWMILVIVQSVRTSLCILRGPLREHLRMRDIFVW